MNTHIYQVNDCDWVAARSLAEAAEFYKRETGEEIDHDEAYELGDEELSRKIFRDIDGIYGPEDTRYTFCDALVLMLQQGVKPPFLFASSEY